MQTNEVVADVDRAALSAPLIGLRRHLLKFTADTLGRVSDELHTILSSMANVLAVLLVSLLLAGCSNSGDECFARVKSELKDPESSSLVSFVKRTGSTGDSNIVVTTIRASNSFGAFSHVYGTCTPYAHKVTNDADAYLNADGWTMDSPK